MKRGIYLDNAMTTRPSPAAISKMLSFYSDKWGTPSAPHHFGQQLYHSIEEAYHAIYRLVDASPKETFVFTSSGSEATNHIVQSAYFDITCTKGKNQFLTSKADEAAAILSIGRLEQLGCAGKMVALDKYGRIDAEALIAAISPRTALLSLCSANGLTGVIQPLGEIRNICFERGILLHIDATHTLGRLLFSWEETGASFISFNGDHLHAPQGTGGFFIKEGVRCSPFILGGVEQGGKRAGTLNVAALAALATASTELLESREFLCTEIARLRNYFEKSILTAFPDAVILFNEVERLPCRTAIAFPGIANEALLWMLNKQGVYSSIGGGAFQQLSLMLSAAGVPPEIAMSAVSFCLSRETTEEEIDKALEIIVDSVQKLRKLSITFR